MSRIKTILAIAILCLVAVPAHAGDQATLNNALLAARTNLVLDHGKFAGDAAPILTAAIDQARYVLVGEDHLTHEIPQFTQAACDVMARRGFAGIATETAPQVGELIGPLLERKEAAPVLAALARKYPNSVAFMDMEDEVDLVSHCAHVAGPKKFHFWGLDQEFLGSTGWLLDRIAARFLLGEARIAIEAMRREEQRDAANAAKTGDPRELFLLAVSRSELDHTLQVLLRAHDAVAVDMFRELVISHDIYTDTSGSHSNRQRALLLKQNFLHDLRSVEAGDAAPRVLLKFGDTHLYRGFNELHQLDLGNFVAELADGQASQSLHIAVLGARGVHRLFAGYARPTQLQPFSITDDPSYRWLQPAIANLLPAGWTMFDLRTLRFGKLAGADAEWLRMIYGYDLLVIIPTLTPANPL